MGKPIVVDAHLHVFPEINGRVAAGRVRGRSYGVVTVGHQEVAFIPPLSRVVRHTPEMLLRAMDWAGVRRGVLLQGPFYGPCDEYTARAVARHPDRLVAAAYFDPWSDGEGSLDRVVSSGAFCAVKVEFSEATGLSGLHCGVRLDEEALAPLWRRLADERLVLTLDLGKVGERGYQTDAVRKIATAFPQLRIVIAHLAQPSRAVFDSEDVAERWRAQIELGRLPNVWFDTASLFSYFADEPYPFPSAWRALEEAVAVVGPDKIMWGSDMPTTYQMLPYPELVALFQSRLGFVAPSDRALICGETALEVYRR